MLIIIQFLLSLLFLTKSGTFKRFGLNEVRMCFSDFNCKKLIFFPRHDCEPLSAALQVTIKYPEVIKVKD